MAPRGPARRSPLTNSGASAVVVEKTAAGVYSGGCRFDVDGPQAVEHLDALCFGKADRSVLKAFARLAGPLHGLVGSPNGYAWRPDNSPEIEAGWIKRGRDSAELAAATGLDPAAPQPALAGGGLTDAIVFGRIAGAEAARATHPTTAGAAHA